MNRVLSWQVTENDADDSVSLITDCTDTETVEQSIVSEKVADTSSPSCTMLDAMLGLVRLAIALIELRSITPDMGEDSVTSPPVHTTRIATSYFPSDNCATFHSALATPRSDAP